MLDEENRMHELTGYADRWSVKQGGAIRFMVSSAGGRDFTLRFVRHLCADPNPAGPGYSELAMPTPLDGARAGREQHAHLGSFAHAVLPADLRGGVRLSATIWPTTPRKGRQGVLGLRVGDWHFALGIGPGGGAMAEATGPDGTRVRAEVPRRLLERRWYDVTAELGIDGRLHVSQAPRASLGDAGEAATQAALPPEGAAEIFIAALPPEGDAPASAHFNGKIERPSITRPAPSLAPLAIWDFAIGIQTQTATDIGPHAAHARLVNLPTRAMTGANWTGAVHDWKSAPEQYGAIHFHDDDRGPLGWAESFSLTVPPDWPSGFYAAHIVNEAGEDFLPFIVRPARPASDVVLLVPTFSYQVYGCHARPNRGAEIAERAAAWNSLPQTPDMNPQFGLSCYNDHSDGSGVALVTQHRPMLDTRPRQFVLMDPVEGGSGTSRWVADNYIDQWLHTIGVAHDVITDHDLHEEGVAALLPPYRVVIAGPAPGISLRTHDAGLRGPSRAGRAADVSWRQWVLLARRTIRRASPDTLESPPRRGRHPRVGNHAGGKLSRASTEATAGYGDGSAGRSHKLVGISFSVPGPPPRLPLPLHRRHRRPARRRS